MSTPLANPSVKFSYIFHGNQVEEKEFNAAHVETMRLGLPLGSEPVKPPPGDYSYSGVHDSGPLLPPKEGGLMADMISFVMKAKEFNDTFMTNIIENEKNLESSQENPPEMKKARN